MKKGIVLKCQGNPVSCYGKRSYDLDRKLYNLDEKEIASDENSDLMSIEKGLDQIVQDLASDCNTGDMLSCRRLRKIILMHSDK